MTYLHVFTYSERENTIATGFANPVEPKVRFRRNELLRGLGERKRLAFFQSFVGKTMPVLFEQAQPDGMISGLASNYIRVEVPCTASIQNTLQSVCITRAGHDRCVGTIVEQSPDTGETSSKLRNDLQSHYSQAQNILELQ